MNYKKLIFAPLLLCSVLTVWGQKDSEIRNYTRSYAVRKNFSLEVTNKYGAVHLTTWDVDSVSIRAEAIAYGPDRSRISKMFDGLEIDITDYDYVIRARTEFSQNFNMFIESFKGMTSKMIPYDSRLEINYYISLPEYLNINIENRYGDVFLENSTGTVSITISNGSLKAGNLLKAPSINLSFCDAVIQSIGSGRIDASLSEITIDETTDLTIKSIGSKIEVEKAGDIRVDSRRDKFFIGTVETLSGSSYFTDYRIDYLLKKADITSKYGDIDINNVEKGFGSINIISNYSDVSLNFDESSSYNLEIRHVNAHVVLPDNNKDIEKETLDYDKKEYTMTGKVGNNPGTSEVKLDATRGNIYIK